MLRFGYNTNGFSHHRLEDALAILAELGYQSIALTLDYNVLNPYEPNLPDRCEAVGILLERLQLHCVIETGARFLLDPLRKHQPTLVSVEDSERQRRLNFLKRAVDIAELLGAEVVSFWSGAPTANELQQAWMNRLVEACKSLGDYAAQRQVRLAFEPEPGMVVDSMARFAELHQRVNHPAFGLTLDVGHLHCQAETPIADHIRHWSGSLWNVHIEDMRRGVHEHLMFGHGEIDFGPVLRTLEEIDYSGGVHVELSRHSHDAVETARQALAFLRQVR
jgi:sugar phosphate isomerase/epimerase